MIVNHFINSDQYRNSGCSPVSVHMEKKGKTLGAFFPSWKMKMLMQAVLIYPAIILILLCLLFRDCYSAVTTYFAGIHARIFPRLVVNSANTQSFISKKTLISVPSSA